jgi:hypothetical protein
MALVMEALVGASGARPGGALPSCACSSLVEQWVVQGYAAATAGAWPAMARGPCAACLRRGAPPGTAGPAGPGEVARGRPAAMRLTCVAVSAAALLAATCIGGRATGVAHAATQRAARGPGGAARARARGQARPGVRPRRAWLSQGAQTLRGLQSARVWRPARVLRPGDTAAARIACGQRSHDHGVQQRHVHGRGTVSAQRF